VACTRADTGAALASSACSSGLLQPSALLPCFDSGSGSCFSSCDAHMCSGQGLCLAGVTSAAAAAVCDCRDGFSGRFCSKAPTSSPLVSCAAGAAWYFNYTDVPVGGRATVVCCGGVLLPVAASARATSQQQCCEGAAAALDVRGECCVSGVLDACGV
jgi:hypothetical protein